MNPINYPGVYSQTGLAHDRFHKDLIFYPKEREKAACTIDANSVARNTAEAVSSSRAVASLVNGSLLLGGVLGVPLGACLVRNAALKGKASLACGDLEGAAHQALFGSVGASYAGISGVMGVSGVLGMEGAAAPAVMGNLFSGLSFAIYAPLTLYGAHGLQKTTSFGKELQKKKAQGELKALQWIYSQVNLTKKEIETIERTSLHPEKEIQKRLQKKWHQFEFRTDPECAKQVRETLPHLMAHYKKADAQKLIETVEKANFKQQVKYALLLAIALLGIAASVALVLTTGPFSPILFAVGAVLWLAIDSSKLHNYIGEKCWTWHRGEKKPELPCPTPLTA